MASATAVNVPGSEKITSQSASLEQQAKGITITDHASASAASALKNDFARLEKEIDSTFDPLIKAAHEQHKATLATKKKFSDPVAAAKRVLQGKLVEYEMDQQRKRREEQARLERLAREEREAQALREAQEHHAQGNAKAAEQVIQEAIEATAPVVVVQRERVEGTSFRGVWKWEITDLAAFLTNTNLLVVKESPTGLKQEISTAGVGALVRSMKDQASKQIRGVKVWEDKIAV